MKRVSVYAKTIRIEDGPVVNYRPGQPSKNLIPNTPSSTNYRYILSTSTMVPKERLSLMAAGNVCINTLTEDESGEFYDLGEVIVTDKILNLKVRQFLTGKISNLNGEPKYDGFVKLDIEF